MDFRTPWVLFLIPVVISIIYVVNRKSRKPNFRFSNVKLVSSLPVGWKVRFRFIPNLFRLLSVILLMVALAGPRFVLEEIKKTTEGVDIVLAIDSSGSMAAEDFMVGNARFNRLEIVKKVVAQFIDQRTSDQIGLVTFAGLAYTVCPLTMDTNWLHDNLDRIELDLIKDGTAVGSAITSSVARLKNSKAKSKVIILLTDGISNSGEIDPLTAAKVAKAFDIKVYTIGAGTKGYAPFPTTDFFGRKVYKKVLIDLDENTLKEIAKLTGAKYFRATDTESLIEIYKEIDLLEKTEIEEIGYYQYEELFNRFLLAGLAFLFLEVILKNTIFLKLP